MRLRLCRERGLRSWDWYNKTNMSGTNRLMNSIITKKGGSESALDSALQNANEVAKKEEGSKK